MDRTFVATAIVVIGPILLGALLGLAAGLLHVSTGAFDQPRQIGCPEDAP